MIKIEKEKRKVSIVCIDKSVITGFIHINPGTRISDFLNRTSERFIVLTNANFKSLGEVRPFKLYNELSREKSTICLNKETIKWLKEA